MTRFIQLSFQQLFLRVKFVFKVRMTAYFSTGKRFYGCNNRESNVKSYENLDTNGGNISIFQCKKPPNSRKDNTNANVLRVMKHMRTTKFN